MSKNEAAVQHPKNGTQRLVGWLEDPMGSIIFASVLTIGSLAVVGSGIWAVGKIVV